MSPDRPNPNGTTPAAIYLDGHFCDAQTARVSLLDRGYLYGDSIFETLRCYEAVPFRLRQHLDRLERGSQITGIALPKERGELAGLVHETITRSGCREAVVRVTVSRGEGGSGISPEGCGAAVLSIIVRPFAGYPEAAYLGGIRTKVVETRRIPAACLNPAMKCGNYLPSILARRELDADEMIEGVQLGVDGGVVGGTVSNVFLIGGDRLRTPDLASGCLPGITRAAVLEVAAKAGLTAIEERIEPADLAGADEMFFTNTLMECLPVAEIDRNRFAAAPGPGTRAIHAALRELIKAESKH